MTDLIETIINVLKESKFKSLAGNSRKRRDYHERRLAHHVEKVVKALSDKDYDLAQYHKKRIDHHLEKAKKHNDVIKNLGA